MPTRAWVLCLALLGCPGPTLPQGSWVIQGHGIRGGLVGDGDSMTVSLQGSAWTTGPDGATGAWVREVDDSTWLYFPVSMAAGQAEAAMQLDLDAGTARLPLGFREGEHVYALTLAPGTPPALASLPALSPLQRAWQGEGFTLRDGSGELAGSLFMLPGKQARVQLVTVAALTDGVVPAVRKAEGPDLLLAFPVAPQFADELGLIRLNLPTMKAVMPVDHQPHPSDLWLEATAGAPSEQALETRSQQVRAEALRAERVLLTRLTMELSGAALAHRTEHGRCPTLEELQPDWKILLGDYRLRVNETAGDCLVHLEPHQVQHTRRIAMTASAQGLLEVEVLGAD